ncbi:tryptophan synthase subunit alpha [Demequina capsici]|uniref:Tryptophan synthase alpha chain n=1 Tax=Demequina capsici TaxID=3075620 RepID=A0AA96J955_9MICO|nr:tryptophan synthase subunit alpha [Demequina sp. OYTSA14]WNM23176.1 tryptophan synthase subunit alpha [Demequina sp. OYTSA14]
MTALGDRLDQIKAEGRSALIGYLPVGYPSVEVSVRAMQAMVEAGVDVVEVGLPYSDPVMDGATIQHAAEAALERGVRVADVFAAVRGVVEAGAPAVVMSYWNPILQYGPERFADDLLAAGGSGVILPDITPDSGAGWAEVAAGRELDTVHLVALTTTPERMHLTCKASSGFVYAAALMGVTGERSVIGGGVEELVERAREAGAPRVCVGLGVTTGQHAAQVARYADGVIVGSALVRCLVESPDDVEAGLDALRAKTQELAAGVRGLV